MNGKCVAVIGTLDTKGPEYSFLLTCLRYHGLEPVLIDISLLGINPDFNPAYTVHDVARRAGEDFGSVAVLNKIEAGRVMVPGAKGIVQEMQSKGRLDGIIALGGANGTLLAGEIMKSLRVFLPKLIVSVVAAGDPRVNVGTKDIVLVNSVSDICLNRFTARIMANAAAAFAGMIVLAQAPVIDSEKKLVAGTMLGLNQTFVLGVKELIEKNGKFALKLLSVLSRTSERIITIGLEIRSRNLAGRVAYVLLFFAKEIYHSNIFELPVSRKEIAEFIGMSSANVIRTFSELKRDGIIRSNGRTIEITDLAKLEVISRRG